MLLVFCAIGEEEDTCMSYEEEDSCCWYSAQLAPAAYCGPRQWRAMDVNGIFLMSKIMMYTGKYYHLH